MNERPDTAVYSASLVGFTVAPVRVQNRAVHLLRRRLWLSFVSLDRELSADTAVERANAALFRVRDEVQEFARWFAKLYRRCLFQRLRNVEAAEVNKFERRFDFVSIFCAEAGAAQPNHIYSEDGIALCCDDKRWQILPER
jgi:hypothetical protein